MNDEKAELAQWYLETIGYDPFLDDPEMTVEKVRQTKAEYLAEIESLADTMH